MIYDFGYRLKELRKDKKMTQTQVASRLNLSKTAISGYENNIKTPSVDVLIQLALLYDVSTDYLLGLKNKKTLCLDGLSDSQQDVLRLLAKELRGK